MRVAVVDLSFPLRNQADGLASLWLRYRLKQSGCDITDIHSAQVICATGVSATQHKQLRALRKIAPSAFIAVGGACSLEPSSMARHCDVVCVGDGQAFLSVLVSDPSATLDLPNAFVEGQVRPVTIDHAFPWQDPPIQGEDGAYRVFLGRGCANKCAFCPTGWGYCYSETPTPQKAIRDATLLIGQGKKVAYLTNDLSRHKWAGDLPKAGHASLSVAALRATGLPSARQIRLGVEGVSERLRKAVAKPISRRDLVDASIWLGENGKSVRWFLIAGLPGETEDDWQELRDTVQEYKFNSKKGVVCLSFTAFHRHPCAPLRVCAVDDLYWERFAAFKNWFFGGPGFSPRIKITIPQQPKSRMESDLSLMDCSESALRDGDAPSPNDRVEYPHRDKIHAAQSHYWRSLS